LLVRWGFEDAMLLDIHPTLASVLSNPRKRKENLTSENSYYFVPDEREIIGWTERTVAVTLNGSNIQYDYYKPIEGLGLEEDFFSVSLRH